MPRRKKEAVTAKAAPSSVKPAKKKKRIGVAVRVVKEKLKPVVPAAVEAAVPTPAATPATPVQPVEAALPPVSVEPQVQPAAPSVIEQPAEPVQAQPAAEKADRSYSDKEKSMILWTAVIFIMIMVFGLWFMSIKLQLRNEVPDNPTSQFDFKKVSDDISSAMREASESLKQLATTTPTSTPATDATATSTATSTDVLATTTPLDDAAILNTIKELEAQLNRGTTTATSTAR